MNNTLDNDWQQQDTTQIQSNATLLIQEMESQQPRRRGAPKGPRSRLKNPPRLKETCVASLCEECRRIIDDCRAAGLSCACACGKLLAPSKTI